MAFSSDGRRIASDSWDQTIKLWDTVTGQEPLTLRGHSGEIESVAFSPDCRRERERQLGPDHRALGHDHGPECTLNRDPCRPMSSQFSGKTNIAGMP